MDARGTASAAPHAGRASSSTANRSCQVQGCVAELRIGYHSKYRVCDEHATGDVQLTPGGEPHRFCQQCSKFHPSHHFDENRRSCRQWLARHKERRQRKTELISAAAAAAAAVAAAAESFDASMRSMDPAADVDFGSCESVRGESADLADLGCIIESMEFIMPVSHASTAATATAGQPLQGMHMDASALTRLPSDASMHATTAAASAAAWPAVPAHMQAVQPSRTPAAVSSQSMAEVSDTAPMSMASARSDARMSNSGRHMHALGVNAQQLPPSMLRSGSSDMQQHDQQQQQQLLPLPVLPGTQHGSGSHGRHNDLHSTSESGSVHGYGSFQALLRADDPMPHALSMPVDGMGGSDAIAARSSEGGHFFSSSNDRFSHLQPAATMPPLLRASHTGSELCPTAMLIGVQSGACTTASGTASGSHAHVSDLSHAGMHASDGSWATMQLTAAAQARYIGTLVGGTSGAPGAALSPGNSGSFALPATAWPDGSGAGPGTLPAPSLTQQQPPLVPQRQQLQQPVLSCGAGGASASSAQQGPGTGHGSGLGPGHASGLGSGHGSSLGPGHASGLGPGRGLGLGSLRPVASEANAMALQPREGQSSSLHMAGSRMRGGQAQAHLMRNLNGGRGRHSTAPGRRGSAPANALEFSGPLRSPSGTFGAPSLDDDDQALSRLLGDLVPDAGRGMSLSGTPPSTGGAAARVGSQDLGSLGGQPSGGGLGRQSLPPQAGDAPRAPGGRKRSATFASPLDELLSWYRAIQQVDVGNPIQPRSADADITMHRHMAAGGSSFGSAGALSQQQHARPSSQSHAQGDIIDGAGLHGRLGQTGHGREGLQDDPLQALVDMLNPSTEGGAEASGYLQAPGSWSGQLLGSASATPDALPVPAMGASHQPQRVGLGLGRSMQSGGVTWADQVQGFGAAGLQAGQLLGSRADADLPPLPLALWGGPGVRIGVASGSRGWQGPASAPTPSHSLSAAVAMADPGPHQLQLQLHAAMASADGLWQVDQADMDTQVWGAGLHPTGVHLPGWAQVDAAATGARQHWSDGLAHGRGQAQLQELHMRQVAPDPSWQRPTFSLPMLPSQLQPQALSGDLQRPLHAAAVMPTPGTSQVQLARHAQMRQSQLDPCQQQSRDTMEDYLRSRQTE